MSADRIVLAHGGGGQLMAELISQVILPAFGASPAGPLYDSASVRTGGSRVLFTTDSYVVLPVEFAGGDIGKLAVCGTINDLAVCGARPVALSLALVLEDGLEIDLLRRVLGSAGAAAKAAGVAIVTGDTKVVERHSGAEPAGIIFNTAGVGSPLKGARLSFGRICKGDAVVLSGPLGQHGLAVMCQRKGLSIFPALSSDCAPLHELSAALIGQLGAKVKWMRDPTRGGLAATLVELAAATGRNVEISQAAVPVDPNALAAAELLGLDLLNVANEGKLVAVVAREVAGRAAEILRGFDISRRAAVIGTVGGKADPPLVELLTRAGGRRVIQMPYGEDLPRIC